MKERKALALLGGIAASVVASACGSAGEGGAGGGFASTSGVDGGELDAGSRASAAGGGGGSAVASGSGGASSLGGAGGGGKGGTAAAGGVRTSGPVTSVTPVDMTAACATQSLGATAGVLDVFIMLDRSESMTQASAGGTKWEVITQSIDSFVKDPKSSTLSAGIGFFGINAPSAVGQGSKNGSSCTAADYAKPVVPIALLGGATNTAAKIASAIQAESPGSSTPTEPALQGAVSYASAWAKQNPSHKVIVVLATDGLPNGCNSTVDGASKIAAAAVAANPSIQTYVIGVFGDQDCPGGVAQGQACMVVTNTNQIAKGGGTGSAFIVNASASTGAQFLAALTAIRSANQVGCDFKVPAPAKGEVIDFSRASVRYTPGQGAPVALPWAASAGKCSSEGGWYYDNDATPNQVHLCDPSCKAITADPMAKIDVLLACEPPGTTTTTGSGGAGNGSGGRATSGGGTTGSAGSPGTGGTAECLLAGQSCQTAAECCGGLCTGGVCESLVR